MHLLMTMLRLPIRCSISKTALDWFEPLLTSGINVPWHSNYSEFVSELRSHFGPFNPEGEAEVGVENLCMHDNQRITKYLVEFNRLAARVQWGNAALQSSSITDICPGLRMKFPGLGNPTIFRTYKPCHRPLMPNTGNTDPKPLEKLQQTEPRLTRRSQMTRVKQHLTLRPRLLQTRKAIVAINLVPLDPIQPTPVRLEFRSHPLI